VQKLPHLYRRAATSAGEATTVSSATAARSGVEKENSRASKPQVGRGVGSYAVAGQLLRLAISSRSPYVSYFEFSNIIYSLQYSGIKRDCVDTTQMHVSLLLRTTLPRITISALFPPVSSRGARSCREPVSLPISTTEKTHETQDIGLGI
jgi:hypothetical protein